MTSSFSPDRTVNWGILGSGAMARRIAAVIDAVEGARLSAVASRDAGRAQAFAADSGAARWFGDYAGLAGCDDVDIVYVATPPASHLGDVLLCLNAGRHVLCEKPFALDAAEARIMVARAREKDLFLMEAMWTRLLPLVEQARRLVREGAIGAPRMLIAGGAFQPEYDPSYYLHDSHLGGGVMRDAGIYLLHLAHAFLGMPTTVKANRTTGAGGVDTQAVLSLAHEGGALATLHVSMEASDPPGLRLLGDKGSLWLEPPVFDPRAIVLTDASGQRSRIERASAPDGYSHEIAAASACVRAGRRQSERMPLADSLAVMEMLDAAMA